MLAEVHLLHGPTLFHRYSHNWPRFRLCTQGIIRANVNVGGNLMVFSDYPEYSGLCRRSLLEFSANGLKG